MEEPTLVLSDDERDYLDAIMDMGAGVERHAVAEGWLPSDGRDWHRIQFGLYQKWCTLREERAEREQDHG